MIPMNNYATEAVKKLSDGKKNITGNKEKAMAGAVHDALKDFCLQDPEFAQAVVQGGNFADCMKAVAKGVGNAISDIEAYRKAVQFYRRPEYLSWPIPEFNSELYAEPGDFIIFGGRPSTGKSAFAVQCAWHWAQRVKVGFFSFETSSEKLFDRQMSMIARISMSDIKRNTINDAGWQKVANLNQDIVSANLELIRAAGMSAADIRAMTVMKGYKLIIIDYLQLIQSTGENRTAQVTNISIALHTLAQSLGVTVVALSQLARQNPQGGELGMASLRESGQIEQDADIVMILKLANEKEPSGDRVLDVAKNKEGTCPAIKLAFDGQYQTFRKAQRTGETVSQIKAMAKKEKQKQREESRAELQMSILPSDYPVPF